MASRFQFGAKSGAGLFRGKVKRVKVIFKWCDSFRKGKTCSDHDVEFEKTAVLFNMAALNSSIATKADRSTGDGIKLATKHFGIAAGIFTYLAAYNNYDTTVTMDINKGCTKMLSHLMLAQAQACFFEMAIQRGMRPAAIAKLAQGTASLFGHALSALNARPGLPEWMRQTQYPWANHMRFQQQCFEASARYWQSKDALEKKDYGGEIGWLYVAQDLCRSAAKINKDLESSLERNRKTLYEHVVSRLAAAIKDNETVYYAAEKKPDQLGSIDPKIMVKATPFEPAIDPAAEAKSAFNNLVPLAVQEANDAYIGQLKSTLSEMKAECQEKTDMVRMQLSSLNLPAALEALDGSAGLPEAVWNRVKDVQYKGGISSLGQAYEHVQASSSAARAGLAEIDTMLQEEEAADNKMRERYGAKWNRVPSKQITAAFNRDRATVSSYLDAAQASDRDIGSQLETKTEMLSLLEASSQELEATLPASGNDETKDACAQKLHSLLDTLTDVIEARGVVLQKLEADIGNENITTVLLSSQGKITHDEVFAQERRKFEGSMQQISGGIEKQEKLLEEVIAANEEFVASRSVSDATAAREAVLQRINDAVALFEKLLANLQEGANFYADIMKDYLDPLKQTVSDFVFARGEEQRILMEQMTHSIAGFDAKQQQQPQPAAAAASGYSAYQALPASGPSAPSAPPSNPNMAFNNNPSHPAYPQQEAAPRGYGRPSPAAFSGPPGGLGAGSGPVSASSGSSSSASKSDMWACASCTFLNRPTAVVCAMCDADNPNPAPVGSNAAGNGAGDVAPAAAPSQEANSGWRRFFS
jgi:programmed cell death 6-interacting protein